MLFSIMDSSKIPATWDWINISVLKVISTSTKKKQESRQDHIVRWTKKKKKKRQQTRFFKNGLFSVTGKLLPKETAMVTCRAGGESTALTAPCKAQS